MELSVNTSKGDSEGSRRKAKGITIIVDQLRSFWLKYMHLYTGNNPKRKCGRGFGRKVSSSCLDCQQQDRQEAMGKAGRNVGTSPTLCHGLAADNI